MLMEMTPINRIDSPADSPQIGVIKTIPNNEHSMEFSKTSLVAQKDVNHQGKAREESRIESLGNVQIDSRANTDGSTAFSNKDVVSSAPSSLISTPASLSALGSSVPPAESQSAPALSTTQLSENSVTPKDVHHENGIEESDTSNVKKEDESISATTTATTSPTSVSASVSGPPIEVTSGITMCQNCQTTTTPLWRRDESGQILCNACGLFFKLHGRPRPISLKTNVIKSRNRARNTNSQNSMKRHLSKPLQQQPNQSTPAHHGILQSPMHMATVNSQSPSFSAISPHLLPHGSPTTRSTLVGGPQNNMDHHLEHLPSLLDHSRASLNPSLSLSPINGPISGSHSNPQQQVKGHNLHTTPSTPSTMFSYPNSPNFGPLKRTYNLPPVNSGPHLMSHGSSIISGPLIPGNLQGGQLQTSANLPGNLSNGNRPVLSPAVHPGMSPSLPPLSSLTSLTPLLDPPQLTSSSSSNQAGNKKAKNPPHILTPQSRPQSPVSSSYFQAPSMQLGSVGGGAVRLGARGEAMSEQLRPRSPDGLDKIPPLRHAPASWLQRTVGGDGGQGNLTSQGYNSHGNSNEVRSAHDENQKLKTRVSELELVNDIFRSRVNQLESSEASARKAEATIRESELLLRKRVHELEEKNVILESRLSEFNDRPSEKVDAVKRMRLSEMI